jgi:hypothetical protein
MTIRGSGQAVQDRLPAAAELCVPGTVSDHLFLVH